MDSISWSSELWVEILKRLPAKSICRFRCVCKSWNAVISSSFFMALHHKFRVDNTRANRKSYFLMNYDSYLQQFIVYQPEEEQREGGVRERVTFLNLPYSTALDASDFECLCIHIIGVVNGVVCLASDSDIVLWNPTIRKHIFLEYDSSGEVGFGFDAVKNDFKLVVMPFSGPFYCVFSIEDYSWRVKSVNITTTRPINHGCFVNGTIYWLVRREVDGPPTPHRLVEYNSSRLLLFDCEREELKNMDLPPPLDLLYTNSTLFNHGGMLSVLLLPPRVQLGSAELWVMEEDKSIGNCTSWRKELTLADDDSLLFGDSDRLSCPLLASRIKLSSDHLPVRLGMFDNQPLSSQVFHKSLFLMNSKTYPSHKKPLTCPECSFYYRYLGSNDTLFQSRLL